MANLKTFLWWLFGAFGAAIWFIRRYGFIGKALRMAAASGRMGPSIDERRQFANRTIRATQPKAWKLDPNFNEVQMLPEQFKVQQDLGTVAFLVFRADRMLHEEYHLGFDAASTINAFSVAKSLVSILVGILIGRGQLNLDDTIDSILPELSKTGKKRITVKNLLMMSSGLSWIESEVHPFSHNAMAYYGHDLTGLVKGLNSKRAPGEVYRYVSGNTQILAMIIEKISGTSLSEFTQRELWAKLQCTHDAFWNLDRPDGIEKAFCCFYATPRDFARLGRLYLQDGQWNGVQLLPKEFIVQSLLASGQLDVWRNKPNDIYGWHWWLTTHRGLDFFYARGIRGQYIICQKDLDMVVVRMGKKRNPVDRRTGHPPDLFDHIDAGLEIIKSNPAIAPI